MKHWLIVNENSESAFRLKGLLEKEDTQAVIHIAHTNGGIEPIFSLFPVELVFINVNQWGNEYFSGRSLRFVFISGPREVFKEELTGENLLYLRDEPYKMKDVILLMIKLEKTALMESIDFMFVRAERRIRKVFYSDIQLIERKDSAYTRLHTMKGKFMILRSMNAWLDCLPQERFNRICDQLIVPLHQKKNVVKNCYRFEGLDISMTYRFLQKSNKDSEERSD